VVACFINMVVVPPPRTKSRGAQARPTCQGRGRGQQVSPCGRGSWRVCFACSSLLSRAGLCDDGDDDGEARGGRSLFARCACGKGGREIRVASAQPRELQAHHTLLQIALDNNQRNQRKKRGGRRVWARTLVGAMMNLPFRLVRLFRNRTGLDTPFVRAVLLSFCVSSLHAALRINGNGLVLFCL